MTTRTVQFDSPFLLGFDHTRALIDRAARAASEGYPPYNVEATGERSVRITLAVAGFAPDDLSVTIEGRQLTISGKREPSDKGDQAGLEVDGAVTEHGLLHVALSRPEQAHAVRRIPITAR